MGAMVQIKHSTLLGPNPIEKLTDAVVRIVGEVIGSQDVFAYVEPYRTTVNADAVEIFVQLNEQKISDPEDVTSQVADQLSAWKTTNNFEHPLNLNVIPVEWHYKIHL